MFGVCGAACLMPKAVFDELGGFDEDFFASHEDVDLSYRARLRGYRCRYVADAIVRHHGSATLGTVERRSPCSTDSATSSGCISRTRPASLLLRTLPRPPALQRGRGALLRAAGLLGTFLRAKVAALAGAAAGVAQARGGAARRAASAPTRSGRISSRGGWRPSCARSGSTSDSPARSALTTPDVAAILVNYNAGDELRAGAASRLPTSSAAVRGRRVVVDNASTDGSDAIARRVRAARAR